LKHLKKRMMSMLLVLLTVLSLLPTAALAAESTGTGIKATTNNNYWTTRLLDDGTPYSYRPPMAAGKMLYCMDRGYGYRHSTASFLNSYTYTSATGKDADGVFNTALAQSGLGEFDAQELANAKWMMTYIVDYKGEIPGSLFMALQTYIWDHQTVKSGGDGEVDAGGFANADTYETYLGYIDWMLNEKSKEDAAYQKQIEEYAAQGVVASVVEDDSAKWSVYAKSSVSGRQSFFNGYFPRKLMVGDEPQGGDNPAPDPEPPAGDGTITFRKVADGTSRGLDGAVFNIYRDGQIIGSDVTSGGGYITVSEITTALYSFVEVEAPDGYALDPTPHSVYVDVTDGDKAYTVTASNKELPSMKIIKTDAQSGMPISSGATYSIKSVTGGYSTSVTVGADGTATLHDLQPGVYVVKEESVKEPYIITKTEQTVALRPGKTSEVRFQDYVKPGLEILKKNIADGSPLANVTYKIEQIDGDFATSATTDSTGRIFLENIPVGSYEITETHVPSNVILGEVPQTIALGPGETRTVTFFNAVKPSVTIHKECSVTGNPIQGAKFHIYYASDNTTTGEYNDLGVFYTSASGDIILTDVKSGWYKAVEEAPASGFAIDGSGIHEFYLEGGTSKTVTVKNVPLSALVVYKYDSEYGYAIQGARFQLRYLSGESGTGGTVIGEYTTSENGSFVVTGLKEGTYICEELASDENHVIDAEPQTVYISGKEQDVVTLRFGNAPKGSLLVKKISDDEKREPLSDVEFLVTDSAGTYYGTNNGIYTTDSTGSFLVENVDPGTTLVVREMRAKTGYLLDGTPQTALIQSGKTVSLEFRNAPAGNLLIQKKSTDGKPLAGVEFKVTYADGSYLPDENGRLSSNGIYYTDSAGEILINGVVGTVVATETKTLPGYVIDNNTRTQTAVVKPNNTQTLRFYNAKAGTLVINKIGKSSAGEKPLEGVTFKVTYADGSFVADENGQITSNGLYKTDRNGQVILHGLVGTVVVTEEKSIPGYEIDQATRTQTVVVNADDTQHLYFYNTAVQTLILKKYIAGTQNEPLPGVTFKVTDSSGAVVGPNNGEYMSDAAGEVHITGLTPGTTVTAREIKTVDGFVLDGTPQTILIKDASDGVQSLTFWNQKLGGLELIKVNAANKAERIPNTTFEIRRAGDDALVDTVTTGADGRVFVPLDAGNYYALETESAKNFMLDDTPHYFEVKDGQTTKLEVTNKAVSGILIHKTNAATGDGIYGVPFILYDGGHNPIDQQTSDDRGYVRFEGLEAGRYFLRELENEGYVPDTQLKTVYVKSGETTLVEWENTPITGQIQITKTSADYNSMNGWPAGTPIPGTVFEVYNARTGKLVDTIQTNKNGIAVTKPLPLAQYKIVESRAAEFYGLDKTPIEVEIEHEGQIVKAAMTNKSLHTNVSIKKTGYVEVMPGQSIRYDFSGIANNSTTALTSFYWRDTLPTNAVRLDKIMTGTWNVPGNYKIVYRTNLSGETWRTMYDNLNTAKNYMLDASPAALGLAANEYITEFMVSFGVVPANFRQVEAPRVYCDVLSRLTGGTQFVNQADVGGVYDGQWIMAVSRWVTRVYKPSESLPRTGY